MMDLANKKFYKIGEVSEYLGVESHTLRYWQTELNQPKERKNRAGHRIFTREDIELFQRIQVLVKDKGLTLAGVEKALKGEDSVRPRVLESSDVQKEIGEIRQLLLRARKLLDFQP